ncbi:hypothetical protein B0H17DRAFT_1205996 [Mycena rosella]|uniref:Uncharacterized protein n=1 Tax=Mycena rosella TaxID=1033263 RepID=A0AAD7D6G9_MYCRO|nr:hypothetical protein B0H17DRAFT_1205996 [Mycena rosella]
MLFVPTDTLHAEPEPARSWRCCSRSLSRRFGCVHFLLFSILPFRTRPTRTLYVLLRASPALHFASSDLFLDTELRMVCVHTPSVRRATVYASRPPTRLSVGPRLGPRAPLYMCPAALGAAGPLRVALALGMLRYWLRNAQVHTALRSSVEKVGTRSRLFPSPSMSSYILYASTLCPPHHYSVPLLPAVVPALGAGREAITVPTLHSANAAPPPRRSLHSANPAPAPTLFRAADDPALCVPNNDIPTPVCTTAITLSFLYSPLPPGIDDPPLIQVLLDLHFFARMQAGGRMDVPPHLARDCAEAGGRLVASGGTGPQPIGPTQEGIHEKNARPIVRFERQLSGVPLPPGVAAVGVGGADEEEENADPYAPAASTSAGATAYPTALLPIDPVAIVGRGSTLVRRMGEEERTSGGWRTRGARGFVGGMGIFLGPPHQVTKYDFETCTVAAKAIWGHFLAESLQIKL